MRYRTKIFFFIQVYFKNENKKKQVIFDIHRI